MSCSLNLNWKDILLGILVGYLVIDILMSNMLKKSMPSCVEKLVKISESQTGMMIMLAGIGIGIAVWYFSSRSKEYFVPAPQITENVIEDKDIEFL